MKWVIQKFHLDSKMNEEKAYELIKDAISRWDKRYVESIFQLFPKINKAEVQNIFISTVLEWLPNALKTIYDWLLDDFLDLANFLWISYDSLKRPEFVKVMWDDFTRYYNEYQKFEKEKVLWRMQDFFWEEAIEKMFYGGMFIWDFNIFNNKTWYFEIAERLWLAHIFWLSDFDEKLKKGVIDYINNSQETTLSIEECQNIRVMLDSFHVPPSWLVDEQIPTLTNKFAHILALIRTYL
jgi:hypothetical protein